MTTQTELDKVRKYTTEDYARKALMSLEKRDVVELYLQLKFDKQIEKQNKM